MSAGYKPVKEEKLDVLNTRIAFSYLNSFALWRAHLLFKLMSMHAFVEVSSKLLLIALKLKLPVLGLARVSLFRHFCGGEDLNECRSFMQKLWKYDVGSVLDYSVEGKDEDEDFDAATEEILRTIDVIKSTPVPHFAVFKPTGVARASLLEKIQKGSELTKAEKEEYERVYHRFYRLSSKAQESDVCLMVDAEESWIQTAVDVLVEEMMALFNKEQPVVYTTLQMYRHDRLPYLKGACDKAKEVGYFVGVKIVRGAYMEKEWERAAELGYESPVYKEKKLTDENYDNCVRYCVENLDRVWIFEGTHNDNSTLLLADLMEEFKVKRNDKRVVFSQLLGMSDHLSFNLAYHGYNVRKYVPYGPIKNVLPYLVRRAEENTSIKGQSNRQLDLIEREILRRKQEKRSHALHA